MKPNSTYLFYRNRNLVWSFAITIFFVFLPHSSYTQVLCLEHGNYLDSTKNYVKVWIDGSRHSTYTQALEQWKSGKFLPFEHLDIPSKFRRGAYIYWVALEVENCTSDTFPLLLMMHRLSGDSTWHFSQGQQPIIKKINNLTDKDATGNIPYPIRRSGIWNIAPGTRDTILIKHENFDPMYDFTPFYSDARVYGLTYYMKNVEQSSIFLFGFGAIFSVFFYALGIWIGQRDPAYGWYAGYCLATGYVTWWNFEVDIPSFHFLSSLYEWTYTKVFLHTIFVGICYAQFIKHFLKGKSNFIEKAVNLFTLICFAGVLVEFVLLIYSLHWSWVFYYWFRIGLVVFALLVLVGGIRIKGIQNRIVIAGGFLLFVFDGISYFGPNQYSTHISMVGVLLDAFLFTLALSIRSKLELLEKNELKLQAAQLAYEKSIESERIRTHIAQDIHDEVGGLLTQIALNAQVSARMPNLSADDLKGRFSKLEVDARIAIGQLREIIFAINPDYDNFEEMQAHFRETAWAFWQDSDVTIHFCLENNSSTNPSITPDVKRQLMLICKEAQNNIAKHAQATQVWITLTLAENHCYYLEVKDDGCGFDPTQEKRFHNGMTGMKKRAEQIKSSFFIESAPQSGTIIRVEGCL